MPSPSVSTAARRRIAITLFIAQSLFSAATISAFTLTPIVAALLSGNDGLAGIPATVLMLGRAAAAYPLGWLMDRTGRRNGLALGFLLTTLGLGICTLSIVWGSFWALCVGSVFIGMGRAASEQARFVAAEIYVPGQRARIIGIIVFAGTVGAIGGPLLVGPSGTWATSVGLSLDAGPYAAGGLLTLIATLLIVGLLHPDPKVLGAAVDADEQRAESVANLPKVAKSALPIFQRRPVQIALLAMIIGQLVMSLLMVITPLHMRYHDHSNDAVAWVIAAHNLGMYGLSGLTGWLIDRLGRLPMIVVGALILMISSVMMPLSPDFFPLALALFLLGLGWNFAFIAGSSLLSDALESHERGRVQGISETMIALAAGVASLSTGGAFALGGILAVTAVGLAFSLALLVGVVWLRRRATVETSDLASWQRP